MLRIVPHIEKLLMVQDFVTVPKFGGFVLQTIPASYRMESHSFVPMHKEVTFNATIKHNDGLLVESYMEKYNVDYPKACRMLEGDVNELKGLLSKGLKISFGVIGMFYRGREGQIIYQANASNPFNTESYGFAPFQLKTLRSLQREEADRLAKEKSRKKDTFYIPVNRNILRGIASVAAAVTFFLVVSTPVKEIDAHAYTASFIPSELTAVNRNVVQTDFPSGEARFESRPEARRSNPRLTNGAAQEEATVYYVIVSSVNTSKQANEFLAGMDRSVFKRANKISIGSKIRVYADRFTNREKADAYMAKIRKNPKYADSWVFVNP
ncbi:MAG: SPOR domain-containing protein [Tannerellaceae bacterium]|jgi:hypothetical protein|nr:SPOR domain-containing protein [Tannerellaceae bacterium]